MAIIADKAKLHVTKLWNINCSDISRHCLDSSYTKVTRNIIGGYCNLINKSASNRFSQCRNECSIIISLDVSELDFIFWIKSLFDTRIDVECWINLGII